MRSRRLLDTLHAAGNFAHYGIRRLLRGRVRVLGTAESTCSVCLGVIEGEGYTCGCGAAYHPGCSRFRASCVRCDSPVAGPVGRRNQQWLPKLPVFTEGESESVLAGFRCMSCGSIVSAAASLCPYCAFSISTMSGFECQLCHCEVPPESSHCRHCGSMYSDGQPVMYICPCCSLVALDGEGCPSGCPQ